MCGIIGHIGQDDALPILRERLSDLDYRGYDSAGIARTGNSIHVYKKRESCQRSLQSPQSSTATAGLGHTCWSTHSEPTDANAYAHTNESGDVAVVHNRIIENQDALKAELESRAQEFTIETDTEVVSHLVEEGLESSGDLTSVVSNLVEGLKESFALGVVAAGPDGIVAARRGSPLVLGFADHGTFLARYVVAFIEHTRRVS